MPLQSVLDSVPELRNAQHVAPLPGGLTNQNYKVVTPDGSYVIRISHKDSSLLSIDRENELHNTIAAAEAGVGAPFIAALPEHDALVIGFLEGRALKVFLAPSGLAARLFGRSTGLVFAIFARVTGVDMLADLSSFFRALSGVIDGFGERTRGVRTIQLQVQEVRDGPVGARNVLGIGLGCPYQPRVGGADPPHNEAALRFRAHVRVGGDGCSGRRPYNNECAATQG